MAIRCYYYARVYGCAESVKKVLDFIIGHSYETEIYDTTKSDNKINTYVRGSCKSSVVFAWNLEKYISILLDRYLKEWINTVDDTNSTPDSLIGIKDDISIEIYTKECDMGFAEHYIIINGDIKLNDVREYHEECSDTGDYIIYKGGFKVHDFDFDANKDVPSYDGGDTGEYISHKVTYKGERI